MTSARKRYLLLVAYALCSLPWVVYGALQALTLKTNDPLHWVPESFPARTAFEKFRREFGSGDAMIVSWEGCTLDNPHVTTLAVALREDRHFRNAAGDEYLERVVSGPEVLAELTGTALKLTPEQARARLSKTLVGPDGQTTCLIVLVTQAGVDDRVRAVGLVQAAVTKHCGIAPEDLHMAGPVLDGMNIDLASTQSLEHYAGPSAAVVFLLCWFCLRSWKAAVVVFGLATYCELLTLAIIHFCGDSLTALLIVMPPLLQILAVSTGVHLVNYYADAEHEYGPAEAARRAFALGWLPCLLSAGTTAIGLGSLLVSDLLPVRSFGGYGALGVLLSLGLLLIFLPGTFSWWPPRFSRTETPLDEPAARASDDWRWLSRFVARWHRAIVVGAFAVMVGIGAGMPFLRTSIRIETLFPVESRLLRDYAWLEQRVGPLVPIEVVIHCHRECPLSAVDRLLLAGRLQQTLAQMPDVSHTMSPLNFVPDSLARLDRAGYLVRQYANSKLKASRQAWIDLNYLQTNRQEELWRVTGYVSAQAKIDYGLFLAQVRENLEPLLQDEDGQPLPGVSLNYTGVMPLVHALQRTLLDDLFSSFLSAFVVITLTMILVHEGVLNGLVSMVSNLFPTVLVFGWLGWQGMPIDIGSVMTASIALGIAIDDTLHFLTFFRVARGRGLTPRLAIAEAYQHCATAMVQSSLINGLGLLIFALSPFVPTARFAWMMLFLLMLALLADLLILPAMLLSPLGRYFGLTQPEPSPNKP